MKRPVFLIIFAILLLVSVLLGLSDTDISVADTSVPNDEATSSVSKASEQFFGKCHHYYYYDRNT